MAGGYQTGTLSNAMGLNFLNAPPSKMPVQQHYEGRPAASTPQVAVADQPKGSWTDMFRRPASFRNVMYPGGGQGFNVAE